MQQECMIVLLKQLDQIDNETYGTLDEWECQNEL